MRRRLLTVVIFLFAGIVVNIAVAWSICSTSDWTCQRQPLGDVHWIIQSGGHVPEGAIEEHRDSFGAKRRWYLDHLVVNGRRWASSVFAMYVWTGWPAKCFRGGWCFDLESDTARNVDSIQLPTSLQLTTIWDEPFLPIGIIWPGFAVNALLYAAILWLLIPGPFVLRRSSRRRRGLCPGCGYTMGESAVCSECGKLLPRRAVA